MISSASGVDSRPRPLTIRKIARNGFGEPWDKFRKTGREVREGPYYGKVVKKINLSPFFFDVNEEKWKGKRQ